MQSKKSNLIRRERSQSERRAERNYDFTDIDEASSRVIEEIPFQHSTLENIDHAMYDWVDERLNIFSTTNKGFEKVSVIWVSAERSHQIKKDKDMRDSEGTLILPLITVERTRVVKSLSKKGSVYGNIPAINDYRGGTIVIAKQINQHKTANFLNADSYRRFGAIGTEDVGQNQINFVNRKKNNKVVYETISIPIPVYLDMTYTLNIRTEYQQQMNEIVTPLLVATGGVNYFTFGKNGHRYEGFIQEDYAQENNVSSLEENERQYKTKIEINVLGYVFGADKNQEQPVFVRRENAVQVRVGREHVIFGDEIDEKRVDEKAFYKE
jgi:hypothetical protein